MLKIDVIRFESQDVITTSVAGPVEEVQKGTCYCTEACKFIPGGEGTGYYSHVAHLDCTDCKKTGKYPPN